MHLRKGTQKKTSYNTEPAESLIITQGTKMYKDGWHTYQEQSRTSVHNLFLLLQKTRVLQKYNNNQTDACTA